MPPLTITIDPNEMLRLLQQVAQPVPEQPRAVAPSRHLRKRFFDLLPLADRECAICLDRIVAFEHFDLKLCGHMYHVDCWNRADRQACAVCRA